MSALNQFNGKRQVAYRFAMVFAMVCLLQIVGCKEDEGPSTRDLLVGTWNLDKIDGDKVNSSAGFITLELEADGDYSESGFIEGEAFFYTGEWELDGDEIQIEYDDGDYWEIDLIEVTTQKLVVVIDGDEWEFEKD